MTRFPGNPSLETSPDDFFPTEDARADNLLISTGSPFAEPFFTDVITLLPSLLDFEDNLFSSLEGNTSPVDFLGAYIEKKGENVGFLHKMPFIYWYQGKKQVDYLLISLKDI